MSLEDLEGRTTLTWQCGVAASDQFDPDEPEHCDHKPEEITLDEPAYLDERGRIHLPGRPVECPECGNPVDFRYDETRVMFA